MYGLRYIFDQTQSFSEDNRSSQTDDANPASILTWRSSMLASKNFWWYSCTIGRVSEFPHISKHELVCICKGHKNTLKSFLDWSSSSISTKAHWLFRRSKETCEANKLWHTFKLELWRQMCEEPELQIAHVLRPTSPIISSFLTGRNIALTFVLFSQLPRLVWWERFIFMSFN